MILLAMTLSACKSDDPASPGDSGGTGDGTKPPAAVSDLRVTSSKGYNYCPCVHDGYVT